MPRTKVVKYGNQDYVVPADDDGFVHEEDLRDRFGIPSGGTLYHDAPDGHHALIKPGSSVALPDGALVDHIRRAQAAGRNIARLNVEVGLLQRRYGPSNVDWADNFDWIMLSGYKLPPNYNKTKTDIALIVPPGYGEGQPMRDCFVDPALRYRHQGQWTTICHYFEGSYAPAGLEQWRNLRWTYLCFHLLEWKKEDTLFSYLNAIYTFLDNPFEAWPS